MRSETWLCAAALSLILATPAFAQDASPRLLPSAAAAYGEYQSEVSTIQSAPLKSSNELDKALNTFGAQNPDQLSSGWIAYSAMVAAQDKDFAAAVRDIDGYYGRERVMTGMRNDVGYARTLKGGEKALQSALAVNSKDAGRISSAAAFVKDQAYKLQDVTWGKSRLKDAGGVAGKLKVNAKTVKPVADAAQKLFAGPDLNVVLASAQGQGQASSVWDKISVFTASAPAAALNTLVPGAVGSSSALKVQPKRESTANRIVTLAAFHVLEADATNKDDVKAAMKDKPTFDCIDWSQLQLQACVSAAYTRADLSFCLAEHAIGDAGACFSSVAK
ncbi:MAG: hypothetical protein Q8R02_00670 [Hyphomonadaceae bacterium]|nr:hypothetical protein [Hyphomonadaceae bacterium]